MASTLVDPARDYARRYPLFPSSAPRDGDGASSSCRRATATCGRPGTPRQLAAFAALLWQGPPEPARAAGARTARRAASGATGDCSARAAAPRAPRWRAAWLAATGRVAALSGARAGKRAVLGASRIVACRVDPVAGARARRGAYGGRRAAPFALARRGARHGAPARRADGPGQHAGGVRHRRADAGARILP